MKRKIFLLIGIILVALLSSIFLFNGKKNVVEAQEETIVKEPIKEDTNTKYKVDIKGAVKKPNVYEVESNKRVIDVINMAGGLKGNANTNYVNLSMKIKDEMVIWIYTNEEIKKMKLETSSSEYMIKACNCPTVDNTSCLNSNSNNSSSTNNKVNINTASLEEIMSLNGIGEAKAKSIIDYREKNGLFQKVEDIMNVNGCGEAVYNKIKDNITI